MASLDGDSENPVLVGAEFSLWQVLDFYAGYDPSRMVDEGGVKVDPNPSYHPNDVIAALIAEVRRLRTLIREGRSDA